MKLQYPSLITRLQVISFVIGFSLMTFELAAARILAPTIGSSTYVWTSVIGIIIAALSVGYFIGGKLADSRHRESDISWLLTIASTLVIACLLFYQDILPTIATLGNDVRLQAVLAATLLFAPASLTLGALSPYLVKLSVQSLQHSGRTVASLSALNSIGGIIGTFVTGFVLFGYLGSRETIALVGVLLLLASWLVSSHYRQRTRLITSFLLFFLALAGMAQSYGIEIDTPSAHYTIKTFEQNNRTFVGLQTGPTGVQSAVFTDGFSNELVFWYTQEMASIAIDAQPKRILLLGGGAFTLPQYLATSLPNSTIDVVEIDPKLESISRDYFQYQSPENVKAIAADARTYVNQSQEQYDLILVDVYGDTSIPFSLMTAEFGRAVHARLAPGGFVVANIIGGFSGPCRDVLDAVAGAYLQPFSYHRYTQNPAREGKRNNIIALFSNTLSSYGQALPLENVKVYRDNFVPAERLHYNCQITQTS